MGGRQVKRLPWQHWLLLAAIVISPVALHLSEVLFCCYVLAIVSAREWWHRLPWRQAGVMISALTLVAFWLIYRTEGPLGWGLHTFRTPARFPVTFLDYLPFLVAFTLLSLRSFSRREIATILWAVVATVPVHFLFAFGQQHLGWSGRWTLISGNFPFVEVILSRPHSGRVDAGLCNFNCLGVYAVLCSLAAATLLLVGTSPGQGKDRSSPRPLHQYAVLLMCLLLSFVLLVWSGSRNSWAVFISIFLFFAILVGIKLRYVLVPVMLCCVLVVLAASDSGWITRVSRSVVPTVVWGRIVGRPDLRISPASWRVEVFSCGLDLTVERPLMGWGIGNMAPECEERLGHVVNHAHNVFLQMTSELGIPFALIFSAMMGFVFLASGREISRLTPPGLKLTRWGLYLMAVAVVLLSQISLAVMHSTRLEMIFWLSLAVSFSLVVDKRRAEGS